MRIPRTKLRLAAALVLLAALAAACFAASPPGVTTIERAEFLLSDDLRPPGDTAPWQPIVLPDNWHLSRPGFNGQVWYRLHFNVTQALMDAKRTHGLYSPRNSATQLFFMVNGMPLALGAVYGDPRLTELQRPIQFTVPSAMLHAGDNLIHVRAAGNAKHRHGLSRVVIGPGTLVRPNFYEPRYNRQVASIEMFGAALLFAGSLALAVWWGRRSDPVLLWFAITALTWAIAAYLMLWPPHIEQTGLRQVLFYLMRHDYITPLLVLCLRIGGTRRPRLEALLWFVFAAACLGAALMSFESYPLFISAASVLYLCLTVIFLGWLLYLTFRRRQRPFYFIGLALVTLIAFTGYDWARWMGLADFDNLLFAPFAMPFLMLALGAAVVDRYLSAVRALQRANAELERDVAEKVREVERTYRQVQEALREQAVLRERQRIMADMHDGLGTSLVSLLSRLHSGSADLPQVEQRLGDILADLRSIVDSLEPVEGDLGAVLGNIRYRMATAIEASGVKFIWQVEPLPSLGYLTPDKILSVQRIILEALTNALRHAAASTVTVSAGFARNRNAIIITIADDGAGFGLVVTQAGHGLRNMRSRAAKLGIPIDIHSSPGGGTRVTLELAAEQSGSHDALATPTEPSRTSGSEATTKAASTAH